ncbi:type II toxin-antitoxin system death-on-curing family toxin [Arthrobacter sp. VKM Ac-2550]|uniref:type II toxin-antitoxin system death-on-curing family toxin n=1 Tax=Crystallibacter permensis TaxID=1938888 RepID=UPI00222654D8|nr:Fic family protein [Arthrobacter sp. VKM Ac-2550]MCW2131714.1 death on curing protein [Arthrobacter sp. VKM Ac-2550]
MIRYLSTGQVVKIHNRIIDCPVHSMDALESAVHKPKTSFGGAELYETLPQKAGALMSGLAMNHAFLDGNKRAAWASTQIFLAANESPIYKIDDLQGVDFVLKVITDRLEVDEIAAWLAYRFQK